MKLFEISQNQDEMDAIHGKISLQDVSNRYLVMALGGGRGGEEFFVISDVPPINEKQFEHLMDVSFDMDLGHNDDEWLEMVPANLTDDVESDEWMAQAAEDPYEVMKWKDFADMIIDKYSIEGDDDFDE